MKDVGGDNTQGNNTEEFLTQMYLAACTHTDKNALAKIYEF